MPQSEQFMNLLNNTRTAITGAINSIFGGVGNSATAGLVPNPGNTASENNRYLDDSGKWILTTSEYNCNSVYGTSQAIQVTPDDPNWSNYAVGDVYLFVATSTNTGTGPFTLQVNPQNSSNTTTAKTLTYSNGVAVNTAGILAANELYYAYFNTATNSIMLLNVTAPVAGVVFPASPYALLNTLSMVGVNSANDTTSLANTSYNSFEVLICNYTPSQNAQLNLLFSNNTGSSYFNTGYDGEILVISGGNVGGSVNATGIRLASTDAVLSNTTVPGYAASIKITTPRNSSTSQRVTAFGQADYFQSSGAIEVGWVYGANTAITPPVNAFSIIMTTGTGLSGNIYIYGIP
jgi:hypothetical protein